MPLCTFHGTNYSALGILNESVQITIVNNRLAHNDESENWKLFLAEKILLMTNREKNIPTIKLLSYDGCNYLDGVLVH